MECYPKPLTAKSAYKRMEREEIDLAPEYQRGRVWSRHRKALLIDSLLRGFDLPKFFLREVTKGPFEVVDGQQRLTAIADFFNDDLPLPKESGELAGRRYSTLPADISDAIDDFQLHFSVIKESDDAAVREMFLRLQMGIRLNAAEELNAIAGGMHDYVVNLAERPLFKKKVSFSDNRGAHRHVAAQLARLAVEGWGDVRKADLLDLYKTRAAWQTDEKAKRLWQVIDWLGGIFEDKDPVLRNRGQAVSVVYVIFSLWEDLAFKGQDATVRAAFSQFDEEQLAETPESADYRVALAHSSDQRKSLDVRQQAMLGAVGRYASDVPRRDPKRAFTSEERAAVYYRDQGHCKVCGKAVDFASFHADHVVPWTKGGATTLENVQVLCAEHNLAKGASS